MRCSVLCVLDGHEADTNFAKKFSHCKLYLNDWMSESSMLRESSNALSKT